MTLPLLQPMRGLLDCKTHHFTTCWKIERTDGVTLNFTDHDTNIVVDGDVYQSAASVNASARQKTSGLNPQNVQFIGVIDNDAITVEDLRGGRYRDAKITETIVDNRYPWAGKFSVVTYWVIEVMFTGSRWEAQISGLTRWLQQDVGRLYTRNCGYTLGDSKCTKDLTAFTFSGTISSIGSQRKRFICTSLTGKGAGYFDGGEVLFEGGDNAGLSYELKLYNTATGEFTFYIPTSFNLTVGDAFSAVAGCDKLASTCKTKFSNIINFGGFPFVPGNDKMMQTPNAKKQ